MAPPVTFKNYVDPQFFRLMFPLICEFIRQNKDYFEPARLRLAQTRGLAPLSELDVRESNLSDEVIDAIFSPFDLKDHLAEDANYDKITRKSSELLGKLTRDQTATVVDGNYLLNGSLNSELPLRRLLKNSPQTFYFFVNLFFDDKLFNAKCLVNCNESELQLIEEEFCCIKNQNFAPYLREVHFAKAATLLEKWILEYMNVLKNEEENAAQNGKAAWGKAIESADHLIKGLQVRGSFEKKVNTFLTRYDLRKASLDSPYAQKLKSRIQRLLAWLKEKLGKPCQSKKWKQRISKFSDAFFSKVQQPAILVLNRPQSNR